MEWGVVMHTREEWIFSWWVHSFFIGAHKQTFLHYFFYCYVSHFYCLYGFSFYKNLDLWCHGAVVLHNFIHQSLNSCPTCSTSEISDDEDLWQWSQLEIRLNAFCQSTIPQKKFIIIIIIRFNLQFKTIIWSPKRKFLSCNVKWFVAFEVILNIYVSLHFATKKITQYNFLYQTNSGI